MKAKLLFIAIATLCAVQALADTWTEWKYETTGTFDAKYWYRSPMRDLEIWKRNSVENPQHVQYKALKMFGDTPGCQPIDLVIDVNEGVQGAKEGDYSLWVDDQFVEAYDINGVRTEIWLCDGYTYYDTFFPGDPSYAYAYEDASYFRPETGELVIYSYYHYPDGTVPFLDSFYQERAQGVEVLRLQGAQYKNYTCELSNPHFQTGEGDNSFVCNVNLNDLGQIALALIEGRHEDIRTAAQDIQKGLLPSVKITESGQVEIPVEGEGGEYTLVYVTYKPDGTPYQFGSAVYTYEPDWKPIGKGSMQDGFISKFLETDMVKNHGYSFSEQDFIYPVDVEESISQPGRYRVVNPYGATSPYWNLDFSVVSLDKKGTNYLVVNATDPEKVYVEESASGFMYGTEPLMIYSEGWDWINEGYALEDVPENLWGKLDSDKKVISFAEGSAEDNLLSAKILTSSSPIYGRKFTLWLPGGTGICNQVLSQPGMTTYYTIDGLRVDRPVKGLYIVVEEGKQPTKRVF